MTTPQLTEQYGHVDLVSVVREIFNSRSAKYAGARSNPNTVATRPPSPAAFRKSRRLVSISRPPMSVFYSIRSPINFNERTRLLDAAKNASSTMWVLVCPRFWIPPGLRQHPAVFPGELEFRGSRRLDSHTPDARAIAFRS